MNIRIILKDANGKRFTLPVAGVEEIIWSEAGSIKRPDAKPETSDHVACYDEDHNPIMMVPSVSVVTIYRDSDPSTDDDAD